MIQQHREQLQRQTLGVDFTMNLGPEGTFISHNQASESH